MESKRDEAWREYDSSAKEIEIQKDHLLDDIESKLHQNIDETIMFSARWTIR